MGLEAMGLPCALWRLVQERGGSERGPEAAPALPATEEQDKDDQTWLETLVKHPSVSQAIRLIFKELVGFGSRDALAKEMPLEAPAVRSLLRQGQDAHHAGAQRA